MSTELTKILQKMKKQKKYSACHRYKMPLGQAQRVNQLERFRLYAQHTVEYSEGESINAPESAAHLIRRFLFWYLIVLFGILSTFNAHNFKKILFKQRKISLIFKTSHFMVCFGFFLFPNDATANASEKREGSAFHIKNFEKLTQDDVRYHILRFWNNPEGNTLIEINELSKGYKFSNRNAKKVRYYAAVIWPSNPPMLDTHSFAKLYEDGDYSIMRNTLLVNCYWMILLPTEFAKSDFKKLDKNTLQKIVSNHVKSRGLPPNTYKVKGFTLKKQNGSAKGQKEIYYWKVLADGGPAYPDEKHYFLIYEEKPLDLEDSPQRKPAGSNKSGDKNTGKDEKKPK
jgi:hypothetical protein